MKIGKKLKRDTIVVALSVLILTITTIRVSYAAFFDVRSKSTMQMLSTGELNVLIDSNSSQSISLSELFPTPSSELPTPEEPRINQAEESYAKLTLVNSGDYDSEFAISVGYDNLPENKTEADLIDLRYINIGIYNTTDTSWNNFGNNDNQKYYISLADLEANEDNTYTILNGILNKTNSVNYEIYVWLSENTPTEDIGKLVYLKLTIDSRTLNDGKDYLGQLNSVVEGDKNV